MSDSPTPDPGSAPQTQGQQNVSEVARLLAQIRAEYEAAELGLSGLATGWSNHEFIRKRAHEELGTLVGQEEAARIIAETIWNPDEIATASKQVGSQEEKQSD